MISIRRFWLSAALALPAVLSPALLAAQRVTLAGDAAIYDLVGQIRLEPASGSAVVASVQTVGADAGKLRVQTGHNGSWQVLRVVFPGERVVYDRLQSHGNTTLNVRPDGTFNDRGFWRGMQLAGPEGGEGERVRISGSGSGLHAYADMVIGVPAGRRVAVFLGVGRLEARNINGRLWLSTSSGDVVADHVQGGLNASSGSGDLRVGEAAGDVILSTGSGDVVVQGARGGKLNLSTGSGDVRGTTLAATQLEASTGSGELELRGLSTPRAKVSAGSGNLTLALVSDVEDLDASSGSGDVTLSLPAGAGAHLRVETGSGDIDSSIPITLVSRREGSLVGTIGDGRGNIVVSTGSGSVRLERH
jgi:hypothetical protein